MIVATKPGQGERLVAGPTVTLVKVPGDATEGHVSVVEMHIPADWSGPPPHLHEKVEHCWFVLEGSLTLTINNDTARYQKGSCLFVPTGVPHAFSTEGGPGSVILEVDTPSLDSYFRALASELPPDVPVDPLKVAEIMGRHDTRPVAP